jgi:hypothetical protein
MSQRSVSRRAFLLGTAAVAATAALPVRGDVLSAAMVRRLRNRAMVMEMLGPWYIVVHPDMVEHARKFFGNWPVEIVEQQIVVE